MSQGKARYGVGGIAFSIDEGVSARLRGVFELDLRATVVYEVVSSGDALGNHAEWGTSPDLER
jgi:hypothetical protein